MPAETPVHVSLETKDDLWELMVQLRRERRDRVTWDDVIMQLLADRAELRKLREAS